MFLHVWQCCCYFQENLIYTKNCFLRFMPDHPRGRQRPQFMWGTETSIFSTINLGECARTTSLLEFTSRIVSVCRTSWQTLWCQWNVQRLDLRMNSGRVPPATASRFPQPHFTSGWPIGRTVFFCQVKTKDQQIQEKQQIYICEHQIESAFRPNHEMNL